MLVRVMVAVHFYLPSPLRKKQGKKHRLLINIFIVIISSHSWPMQMVQYYWSSTKTMFGPASEKPAK